MHTHNSHEWLQMLGFTIHCNTLQHTVSHCSTLQHTATHGNILQHTATRCNTLQHTVTHVGVFSWECCCCCIVHTYMYMYTHLWGSYQYLYINVNSAYTWFVWMVADVGDWERDAARLAQLFSYRVSHVAFESRIIHLFCRKSSLL